MVAAAQPIPNISIEEYLDQELARKQKHHFIDGKLIPMAGGTLKHNVISTNVLTALRIVVRSQKKNFIVSNSDTKIWTPEFNAFYYPDAVVICEKPKYYKGRRDVIVNPILIVEVMSPSTQKKDQGNKFMDYATIPSLLEYLTISQDRPMARISRREKDNLWQLDIISGDDAVIDLKSIGCSISMEDIFAGAENL